MKPTDKVLLVDDDPNVLKAYERRLRRRFDVETALCSEEGVTAVNFLGPFAVVVSDMQMPRENGADFLARILDLAPDSVRIMLTGNADQQTAADAVNVGRVFRFLNKPCPAEQLEATIQEGIAEHARLRAERELLSKTVHGAVGMLTHVLSLVNPTAFGRSSRLRSLAGELATAAEVDDAWEIEIAASLSQVGAVTLPEETLARAAAGEKLSEDEQRLLDNQYRVAAELIAEAPRLEQVARIVELQSADPSEDDTKRVLLAAELLRVALAYDTLTANGRFEKAEALHELGGEAGPIDATALGALRKVVAKHDARRPVSLRFEQLSDGMHLVDDIVTNDGMMLVAKGQDVTAPLRKRLLNYASSHDILEPITALVSADAADEIEQEAAATA